MYNIVQFSSNDIHWQQWPLCCTHIVRFSYLKIFHCLPCIRNRPSLSFLLEVSSPETPHMDTLGVTMDPLTSWVIRTSPLTSCRFETRILTPRWMSWGLDRKRITIYQHVNWSLYHYYNMTAITGISRDPHLHLHCCFVYNWSTLHSHLRLHISISVS